MSTCSLVFAFIGVFFMNDNQTNNNVRQQTNETKSLLEGLGAKNATLFHDQYGEAYIAYNGNGSRVVRLASEEFNDWLSYNHWKNNGEMLSSYTLQKITSVLKGSARYDGPLHSLELRIVRKDDGLWYDLANGKTAVHVSKNSWEVTDKVPIIFKQLAHQQQQVEPAESGDVHLLRPYINVESDDDWLLFLVNLISAFITGFPHPLLILHGPQGAGKTTVAYNFTV